MPTSSLLAVGLSKYLAALSHAHLDPQSVYACDCVRYVLLCHGSAQLSVQVAYYVLECVGTICEAVIALRMLEGLS